MDDGRMNKIIDNNNIGSESLLTVDDLCKLLCLKKSYIYNLTFQRKIPFLKIGRHLRFRKSDIEAWLERLNEPDDNSL